MNKIFAAISAYLRSHTPWMILLDNVDIANSKGVTISAWFKELIELLRKCIPGTILITSRHRNLLNYLKNNDNLNVIYVDLEDVDYRISDEQAKQLFFAKEDFRSVVDIYGSEDELKDLIVRLSFLPLAIKIAGIYVQEENIGYKEYRQRLKDEAESIDTEQQIILQDVVQFVDVQNTAAVSTIKTLRSAIQMSVRQVIQKTDNSERRHMMFLLHFCAFLDPESIPQSLLKRFAKTLTKRKVLFINFKTKMNNYSLLRLSTNSVSIHREVQYVIKLFCRPQQSAVNNMELEVFVSTSVNTFETFSTSLATVMPHIASFHRSCYKLELPRNAELQLRESAKTIDDQLNAQMRKRTETVAEQLEVSWANSRSSQGHDHLNDCEVRSKAQLAAVQNSRNFQLPPQNEKFVGREPQLHKMHTEYARCSEADQNMIFVIVGSGGMGKSALALAYLYHSLSVGRYQRALWLYAEFAHQLLIQVQSLVNCWYQLEAEDVHSLTETDFIRMFYDYLLYKADGNTCIVFDNAGKFSSMDTYLCPEVAKGGIDILVTSRYIEWETKFQQTSIRIEQFRASEAALYVQAELPNINVVRFEIEQLNSLLGGLPLAVVQAAAFMKQKDVDVAAYIKLLQLQPVLFVKSDDHNVLTVQHTLTLAINQVRPLNGAVDAVMAICAYLATDHINALLLYSILDEPIKAESNFSHNFNNTRQDVTAASTMTSSEHVIVHQEHNSNQYQEKQIVGNLLQSASAIDIPANSQDLIDSLCTDFSQQSISQTANVDNKRPLFRDSAANVRGCHKSLRDEWTKPDTELVNIAATSANARIINVCGDNTLKYIAEGQSARFQRAHTDARSSVDNALALLHQYSVVSMDGRTVRIHRLTQAVMRNILIKSQLHEETNRQVYEYMLRKMEYDVKSNADVERVTKLIPHALNITELESTYPTATSESTQSQLWQKIGRHQLYAVRNPRLAIKYYDKTLKLQSAQYGENHTETASTLARIGTAYGELGHYVKQRDLLSRALEIFETELGSDHPQISDALINLSNAYGQLGNYEKQRDLLIRALIIDEARFGANHPQTSITLGSLGNAYGQLGDYKKKRDLLIRALSIFETAYGPEHPQVSITLTNLANAHGKLGDFEKKRDLLTRALAIDEACFGPDHPQTSLTLCSLGNAYGQLGDCEKQRDLLTRALVIDETNFGPAHPQTSITLTNLGIAYGRLGNRTKQRDLLARALVIKEAHFGADHAETSITLANLGVAHGKLGDYEKKRDLLVRALAIDEVHFGCDHPQISWTLSCLANAYGQLNDYEKQRELLTRALAIEEVHFGSDHRQTSFTLDSLASACSKLGDYEKKRDLLIRALKIKEIHFGPNHKQTSITLTNLGIAYGQLGDYEKKRDILERALAIKEALFGVGHSQTRMALTNLANAYDQLGDHDSKRHLLSRMIVAKAAQTGPGHS